LLGHRFVHPLHQFGQPLAAVGQVLDRGQRDSGTATTSSVFRISVFMLLKYCTRQTSRVSVELTWQLPKPREIIATGPTGRARSSTLWSSASSGTASS